MPDIKCYRCGEVYARGECGCPDGITLVNSDCREVLPLLEAGSVGVIITDPPYGYGFASGWVSSHRGKEIANDRGTEHRDSVLDWAGTRPWACFGSWRVQPPPTTKTALVWDKGPASGMGGGMKAY